MLIVGGGARRAPRVAWVRPQSDAVGRSLGLAPELRMQRSETAAPPRYGSTIDR